MAVDVKSPEVVAQSAKQPENNFEEQQKLNFEKLRKKTEAIEVQLQQSEELRLKQQQLIEQMQTQMKPKDRDELEALQDDEFVDKSRLKRILEKERQTLKEEALKSARQAYEAIEKENYASRLKTTYPDYEDVVNADNAKKLQDEDPEFMAALAKVNDDYTRRELAYKKMKKIVSNEFQRVKAQEVVEENRKISGNYMAPSAQSPMNTNPYGFEFNVRDPDARKKAYERLRAGQKRGI